MLMAVLLPMLGGLYFERLFVGVQAVGEADAGRRTCFQKG
jgi:hypothetical protein